MRPSLAAAAAIALAAAGCSKDPAVRLHIIAPPAISSDCVVVELTAPGRSPSDHEVARDAEQDELWVALFQKDWPPSISVEAFIPTACGAGSYDRVAHSAVELATFSPSIPTVELRIADQSPAALVFAGALGPQEAATCSPPLELQVRDAAGDPALISTPVTASFSISPDTGLQVFADDACAAPVGSVTIGPAPSATLRVRGAQARSTVLTAGAPMLTSAQTSIDVVSGAPASLAVVSAAQTVLAGECSAPVVMELRDAADNPTAARADLPLAVQMAPAGSGVFYTDATCMTALTSATIATGTSQQTVAFRAYPPGQATLTATAGTLAPATQLETVVPIARRGTCTLLNGTGSVQCPVSPPPLLRTRAFAFFQATSPSSSPSSAMVRCALATPPVTLNCSRDGATGDVNIQWYVVELAYAKVQHLTLSCANSPVPYPPSRLTLTQPVDLSKAFLIHSLAPIGGNFADDFRATRFEDAGVSVVFENELSDCIPGWVYSVQAVELDGASVDRGTASTDAGVINVTGLSAVNRGRSFLLYSWSTALQGNNTCDRMAMGEMNADTSLRFQLGNGNAACTSQPTTVAWERVQLPAGVVQSPTVTMSTGMLGATATLSPQVDLSRTAVFAGGQAVGGQGDGQSAFSADDVAGEAVARHALPSRGQLQLTRDTADAGAKWRPYVVEFQP